MVVGHGEVRGLRISCRLMMIGEELERAWAVAPSLRCDELASLSCVTLTFVGDGFLEGGGREVALRAGWLGERDRDCGLEALRLPLFMVERRRRRLESTNAGRTRANCRRRRGKRR